MTSLTSVIGNYQDFLARIIAEVEAEGFDLADFVQLDHMCYRTSSLGNYEAKKSELMEFGELLGEVQINGRPIATFRLHEPVIYDRWRIDTVELPAPNPGREIKEGLEHVEFVLYDSIDAFLKKYEGKNFNLASVDRGVNPEIGYKLPNYGVKFHLLSLPTVVYLEKKLGYTDIHN